MYRVSAQGVDERMINAHYCYSDSEAAADRGPDACGP